jgi:hypothetical protein
MEMDIEMERLYGDEAEMIKMTALRGSDVPDNTWSFPRGYDYDWSKPSYPSTQCPLDPTPVYHS